MGLGESIDMMTREAMEGKEELLGWREGASGQGLDSG